MNPGAAFSGIISNSIVPREFLEKSEINCVDEDYHYDEFGFRVEDEDKAEPDSSKLLGVPFVENESSRLKWIAFFEFSTNGIGDLNFETTTIPRTEKLRNMVIFEGIPHSLRPQIWMSLSGAYEKKKKSDTTYQDIVKASNNDSLVTSKQIEKDLVRILPSNYCFTSMNESTGIPRLRRILRGIAWLFPDIGYCQGTGGNSLYLLMFFLHMNFIYIF